MTPGALPEPLRPTESEYGPPERVYVENEWYDGPRAGIADVNGRPHRFKALFDDAEDQYPGTFFIWPVDETTVELEQEQWRIFAAWNVLYEAGEATAESHPGHGGKSARWDEIEVLLKTSRTDVPLTAQRASAKLSHIDGGVRYPASGPGYTLIWRIL
jgi:hypothetical protein